MALIVVIWRGEDGEEEVALHVEVGPLGLIENVFILA